TATADYYKLIEKLEMLARNNNMKGSSISTDGVTQYDYVLNFNLQISQGEKRFIYNAWRQVVFMQINATVSPDIAFGNDVVIEIKDSGSYKPISMIYNAEWGNTNESTPKVSANEYQSTNEPQYSTQRLNLTYLYDKTNSVHAMLQTHNLKGVKALYDFKITMNGEVTYMQGYIMTYSHSAPMGGFQVVQLSVIRGAEQSMAVPFTLSLTAATNSQIAVSRYGYPLVNGSTIYSGEELKITASVDVGFTLTSLTANGVAVLNGGTIVVKNNVTIATTVENGVVETFVLNYAKSDKYTTVVKRNSLTIENGAIIQKNDRLTITTTAVAGINIDKITVNGVDFTNGSVLTVTSNVTIVVTYGRLQLSIKAIALSSNVPIEDGMRIIVKRTKTADGAVVNEQLIDTAFGSTAIVDYGDEIQYQWEILLNDKYQLKSFTLNGNKIIYGDKQIITENSIVRAESEKIPWKLTIVTNGGVYLTVKRGTEILSNNAVIYQDDVLDISAVAFDNYHHDGIYINNRLVASGNSTAYTVRADTAVKVSVYSDILYYNQLKEIVTQLRLNYGDTEIIRQGTTPTGWSFDSWNTSTSGTGRTYNPGTSYVGGDLILYAQGTYTSPKTNVYLDMYIYSVGQNQFYNIRLNTTPNGNTPVTATSTISMSGTYKGTDWWAWNATLRAGQTQTGETAMTGTNWLPVTQATFDSWTPKSDDTYNYIKGGIYYLS
ncbi:MAG: InlB B-repeat-containing protein, partial [Clostridia bacterium]